jgi:hypothetical protein
MKSANQIMFDPQQLIKLYFVVPSPKDITSSHVGYSDCRFIHGRFV